MRSPNNASRNQKPFDLPMSDLPRVLEPEVMDTVEEAVDYDSMDHSHVNRVFVDDLLGFMKDGTNKPKRSTAIDLGTGSALILLELLSRNQFDGPMIACDLSAEMLKLAVRNLRQVNAVQNVLPTFCDAKRLPVADQSCEIVISNSIVHHIPDPFEVFDEMRRIIRPDGILFVRDLMRPETADDVERFVQTYAGEENAHQKQMFRQSLHAALTVGEVAEILTASGFDASWVAATSDRHWTVAGRA